MDKVGRMNGVRYAGISKNLLSTETGALKRIRMINKKTDKTEEERQELLAIFFSSTDVKGAKSGGETAYRCLHGLTLQKHQDTIASVISKLNPDNVHLFLEGYEGVNGRESSKNPSVDNFFTQMKTEWLFDNKDDLMKKVASNLKTKFERSGLEDFEKYGKEIGEILKHKELSKDDAVRLDEIVKSMRRCDKHSNIRFVENIPTENIYGSYR